VILPRVYKMAKVGLPVTLPKMNGNESIVMAIPTMKQTMKPIILVLTSRSGQQLSLRTTLIMSLINKFYN
jgi:hypothetical protein